MQFKKANRDIQACYRGTDTHQLKVVDIARYTEPLATNRHIFLHVLFINIAD